MKLTPEQLLQPRYEVIADYPNSIFNVGHILTQNMQNTNRFEVIIDYITGYARVNNPEKYPHIFRKLEWWEQRTIDDMPEYVKYKSISTGKIVVMKSDKWKIDKHPYAYGKDNVLQFYSRGIYNEVENYHLPATETDYQNYLNQTKD